MSSTHYSTSCMHTQYFATGGKLLKGVSFSTMLVELIISITLWENCSFYCHLCIIVVSLIFMQLYAPLYITKWTAWFLHHSVQYHTAKWQTDNTLVLVPKKHLCSLNLRKHATWWMQINQQVSVKRIPGSQSDLELYRSEKVWSDCIQGYFPEFH